jgi:hypothetical protein
LSEPVRWVYVGIMGYNIFNGVLSVLTLSDGFLGYIFVLLFYVYAIKQVFSTTCIGQCGRQSTQENQSSFISGMLRSVGIGNNPVAAAVI